MGELARRQVGILIVTMLLTAGCHYGSTRRSAETAPSGPVPTSTTAAAAAGAPDAQAVKANELGDIPVLMYHRIVETPGSLYDRTPVQFRAELERLAGEDYVPVTVVEVATKRIDIPAGMHPVVLTFDDGDATQFSLAADGRPSADTAIGILLDVSSRNPGFRAVASLYVNAHPFGAAGGAAELAWLREHGFEIGNHTYSHANLASLDDRGVRDEIVKGDQAIVRALPEYDVSSLALPFGAAPSNAGLALRDSSSDFPYDYDAVLLVGAEPMSSPYSTDFDALNVPRIRSQGPEGEDARYGSSSWLDQLAEHPELRYTSDGLPDRISYPASASSVLAEVYAPQAFVY